MSLVLQLEPLGAELTKSVRDRPQTLRTALGKTNRILLGDPVVERLIDERFGLTRVHLSQGWESGFEFLAVSVDLSFVPDFGCRFLAADFSFAFSLAPARSGPGPTVCEISPREVSRDREYNRSSEAGEKLGAELSPGLAKLIAEVSRKTTLEQSGIIKVRELYAFGLNFSEAGWRFSANNMTELAGIYGPLSLVVRKPREAGLLGDIRVGAEIAIEDALDRWTSIACGLSRSTAQSAGRIELCPASGGGA